MRFVSRYLLILLAVAGTFLYFIWSHLKPIAPNQNFRINVNPFDHSTIACRRPELDLNDPLIVKFFKPSDPIECDSENDWVCVDRGKVDICSATRQRYRNVNCNYTFLRRQTDFSTVDDFTVIGRNQPVELKSDFFKVSCDNEKGMNWSNIMAGIRNDPAVHSRANWDEVPSSGLKLNVMIWGFDSLSRNTFMRKLPKTYSYLIDQLGTIVLKGYNIVGDGTPQALIPILTGHTEPELPETRKRMPNAQPVDIYPFVWKEYHQFGYVTAFTEDRPRIGTFTYRLKGFAQQPTDHYMRTFYIAANRELKQHKHLCLRGTPRHKVLMNWVRHFFAMYTSKPKFIFTFHKELSHDDFNLIGSADNDLQEMIKNLKEDGHLDNTLLIIMSDHGHRFAEIRDYQQGKQEERLPFFSFTFPTWFEKKYPQAMANFKINSERLTTPFDIYPTLRDVLHLEDVSIGNIKNRGISLFREIPPNRTCESADIEPHWCTCLDWQPTATDDKMVFRAVGSVVRFINDLTQPQRRLCAVLTLQSIRWAGKYTPIQNLLKFNRSADLDGFTADLSANTKANIELYQVKIHTQPGDGHFEASLKYDVHRDIFTVKEQDISRTNKYGQAADCVVDTQEQLRKFCYCKTHSVDAKAFKNT